MPESSERTKILGELEAQLKEISDKVKKPATSDFAIDSLTTIALHTYREYLSSGDEIPIQKIKEMTLLYSGILDEYLKQEKQ